MRGDRWGSGGAIPAYQAYQASEPVNMAGGGSPRPRLARQLTRQLARRVRTRLMSTGHSRRRIRWLLGFMLTLVTLVGLVSMALPGMRFAQAAPTIETAIDADRQRSAGGSPRIGWSFARRGADAL